MTNLLQAWTGAMLVCIPLSLIFVLTDLAFRYGLGKEIKPGSAWAKWLNTYLILAVGQAVVFAGVVGVAMLTGAFR